MSAQDLYYSALAPRQGCVDARARLLAHFESATIWPTDRKALLASVRLLNAVSLIDLYERTFGAGSYLALLRETGNARA